MLCADAVRIIRTCLWLLHNLWWPSSQVESQSERKSDPHSLEESVHELGRQSQRLCELFGRVDTSLPPYPVYSFTQLPITVCVGGSSFLWKGNCGPLSSLLQQISKEWCAEPNSCEVSTKEPIEKLYADNEGPVDENDPLMHVVIKGCSTPPPGVRIYHRRMRIFVTTPTDRTITIMVSPHESIYRVQQLVCTRLEFF